MRNPMRAPTARVPGMQAGQSQNDKQIPLGSIEFVKRSSSGCALGIPIGDPSLNVGDRKAEMAA
jgi:hypothetical protein